MAVENTTQLQAWIDRAQDGDSAAWEGLIEASCDRLRVLARGQLRRDRVRRWEQTDDVLQLALLELHRDLATLRPATAREFLQFAGFKIRRALALVARRHYGPHGVGSNHLSRPTQGADLPGDDPTPSEILGEAERWDRLHEEIGVLPDEEREVVELVWLHGLTQAEAAQVTGVAERTVQRRWLRARVKLHRALDGLLPGQ